MVQPVDPRRINRFYDHFALELRVHLRDAIEQSVVPLDQLLGLARQKIARGGKRERAHRPGRQEHADLNTAADILARHGVQFYGVIFDDPAESARAWLKEMGGQPYPSLLDPGSHTAIDYGLQGVPETFVIGPDGRIVHHQMGPITAARLVRIVEPYLSSTVPTP
jgi:hypothetical protein